MKKPHGNIKHGVSGHKEHVDWMNMKYRAKKTSTPVEPVWLTDYNTFITDMGKAPTPTSRLHRLNRELGFTKENTFWRTKNDIA